MRADEAAWVREHVLGVLPASITAGGGHLDTACSPSRTGRCHGCNEAIRWGGGRDHGCIHGRPDPEGRLRVAGRFAGPRGCRLPDVPTPDRLWLADRVCRTYCTCSCRGVSARFGPVGT